jgi:ariadne-1
LGLSSDETVIVLRYYKWNKDKVETDYLLGDQDKLRMKIGLDFDPAINKKFPFVQGSSMAKNEGYCIVCYCKFGSEADTKPYALKCGHTFCSDDWKCYLVQKVNEGSTALNSKCPQHECNLIVPHTTFLHFLKGDDLKTYMKWYCKSFTDDNKNVRWCPYAGCDFCAVYQDTGVSNVECRCGNSFCFKCGNESHRPSDCE